MSSVRFILAPAALVLVGLPVGLSAFRAGPYPNVAGGFGDATCHSCHLDNPINAPGGKLDVAGVPPTFTPGATYRITVMLTRQGLKRAGFEIAARFAAGKQNGKQAGSWRLIDDRVQVVPGAVDKELQFAQHTLAGSRAPRVGSNSWTIEWTAPAVADAAVQFDVAGNAANDDDSPLGDYVYVRSVRSLIR
jgi:hypothetical protein